MYRKLTTYALGSLLLLVFSVAPVQAQEREVSGTVTEAATGNPLPGVNVTVKGTTTGTITNGQGTYTLTVPGPDATLVFSFVGFQTEEIPVGTKETIDVAMEAQVQALEQMVVVGYGTQRRQDISGAVSTVDVAEANVGQNSSPTDLIEGRVSGVNIVQNNGEPGGGVKVRIRGTTSLSASSDPLYVIDGVPITSTNATPGGLAPSDIVASSSSNPLSLINPNDIKSIQVLKDAAATAIYGSQGANGVILIETKSGDAGGLEVSYSGEVSASNVANPLDLLSADQYRRALTDFAGSQAADALGSANTDWQQEVFQTAVAQDHNLSFSGGNESTTYRASLGYLDQPGVVTSSGITRYTARVNASQKLYDDKLQLNLNVTGSLLERDHVFYAQSAGFQGGVFSNMLKFNPTFPVVGQGGSARFFEYSNTVINPVAIQNQLDDFTESTRLLGNVSASYDVLESLTAKVNFGYDQTNATRRSYIPQASPLGATQSGIAQQTAREVSSAIVQSTLQYQKQLTDVHRVGVLAGYEFKRETYEQIDAQTQGFVTDELIYNNLAGGNDPQLPGSGKEQIEQLSFFGRVDYNYDDRYILQGTLRRDGASVFGANNKYAYFPAGSIAWRVTNESFMESVNWLNELKVRASYGLSGNQAIPPYQTLQLLGPDQSNIAVFGSGEAETTGFAPINFANPNLKWETTTSLNVGMDFIVGRFDGTIDVYQKKTEDLLLFISVPQPAVVSQRLENIGAVENTGVEFSLNTQLFNRDNFTLNVGGNISYNKNEVTDLGQRGTIFLTPVSGAGQTGTNAQIIQEGSPIGTFYGPVYAGTNAQGQQLFLTADGGTTTNVGDAERRVIGDAQPDFNYGFTFSGRYGNFDFSTFFRGIYGKDVFNNTALEFSTKNNLNRNINMLESALDDEAAITPVYSSRWIQDASFLRLDNLTIGYTLPIAEQLGIQRARIYFSGQNLFVITPYNGYDPEVSTTANGTDTSGGLRSLAIPALGVDYTNYPRARTFTFGVDLGL